MVGTDPWTVLKTGATTKTVAITITHSSQLVLVSSSRYAWCRHSILSNRGSSPPQHHSLEPIEMVELDLRRGGLVDFGDHSTSSWSHTCLLIGPLALEKT